MAIRILNTEINDLAQRDQDGKIQPSEISVLVTIKYEDKTYTLDFQTTTTHDHGAYSSDLESYDDNDDHIKLSNYIDDDDQLAKVLAEIKMLSGVNRVWSNYVDEYYVLSNDRFNGMDGNSEVNQATPK